MRVRSFDRTFALLFTVMLTIAAGNTALQSVLPALGRSLGAADSAVAAVFSVSALLWVIAAPFWANRSDRHGRRAMVLVGVAGFTVSLLLCGVFLALGINGVLGPLATFIAFIIGRVIYGTFGSAAPPAVQAIVAGRTTREERTQALTLLASAFGLGTILGPAVAPYLVLGHLWQGGPEIGLAGPAFVAAAIGAVIWIAVVRMLPKDEGIGHVIGARTLREGPDPITRPEQLSKLTALVHRDMPETFTAWRAAAGFPDLEPLAIDHFDSGNLMLEAAAQGLGVAFMLESHFEAARDERLVQLFDLTVESHYSYWFVCRPRALSQRPVRIFHDWLIESLGVEKA